MNVVDLVHSGCHSWANTVWLITTKLFSQILLKLIKRNFGFLEHLQLFLTEKQFRNRMPESLKRELFPNKIGHHLSEVPGGTKPRNVSLPHTPLCPPKYTSFTATFQELLSNWWVSGSVGVFLWGCAKPMSHCNLWHGSLLLVYLPSSLPINIF